jgi:transcriptional regulator with XRE-family HTH domain
MKVQYDNLQEYRADKGLTLKQLAVDIGLNYSYMNLILYGFRRPSPEKAKQISDRTGIPILNLLFPTTRRKAS